MRERASVFRIIEFHKNGELNESSKHIICYILKPWEFQGKHSTCILSVYNFPCQNVSLLSSEVPRMSVKSFKVSSFNCVVGNYILAILAQIVFWLCLSSKSSIPQQLVVFNHPQIKEFKTQIHFFLLLKIVQCYYSHIRGDRESLFWLKNLKGKGEIN